MTTPTVDMQVSVAGLLMGPQTPYQLAGFNPWIRTARTTQSGERAWNHGSWSGKEFLQESAVPLRVFINAGTTGDWLRAHQAMAAAFAPSQDGTDAEMRFRIDGTEYVMFGRPRMVEPETDLIVLGVGFTRCAFVGLDPLIYAGVESIVDTGLPSTSGGVEFPATYPVEFDAITTSGARQVTNDGTADTALTLRIDGPVTEPQVSLSRGTDVQTIRFNLALDANQWLTVDCANRTVELNDVASRRGQASGDFPILAPGTSELSWTANSYHSSALLTATWRSAWY